MKFALNQQKKLYQIIRENRQASLFIHLGLDGLLRYRSFDLLYEAFKHATPVMTHGSWAKMLRQMARDTAQESENLALRPHMVTTTPLLGLACWQGKEVPVNINICRDYLALEKTVFTSLKSQGVRTRGGIFRLFDYGTGGEQQTRSLESYAEEQRPWWQPGGSAQNLRDLKTLGRSRHQLMHAFYQQLEAFGDKVEALAAPPAVLAQFSLFVAQQRRKFTPLVELCPNLKVYIPVGETTAPYQVELKYLFKSCPQLVWQRQVSNPLGVMAYQRDINIAQRMTLLPQSQVFYEFIPTEDIDAGGNLYRDFRRLYAGQVDVGKEYLLLVTNSAGMVSLNTGWVVRIVGTEPFEVSWRYELNLLNGFGEALSVTSLHRQVQEVNEAVGAQGLFVRNYMVGADISARQHHWVLELSRPVGELDNRVLATMAKRLHAELENSHEPYRQAFQQNALLRPKVSFVPMGTFASLPDTFHHTHIDASPDVRSLRILLRHAGQVQEVSVENL
jgi:hypothetical protein